MYNTNIDSRSVASYLGAKYIVMYLSCIGHVPVYPFENPIHSPTIIGTALSSVSNDQTHVVHIGQTPPLPKKQNKKKQNIPQQSISLKTERYTQHAASPFILHAKKRVKSATAFY